MLHTIVDHTIADRGNREDTDLAPILVLMEDRPSTLGKVCRALADREVNIVAL
jgi:hypothetical protein